MKLLTGLWLALVGFSEAFAPAARTFTYTHEHKHTSSSASYSNTALKLDFNLFAEAEPGTVTAAMEGARREFLLWFVGASGGAGIARSQFPAMYKNVQAIKALEGVGPKIEGGEMCSLPFFCGYPEDISVADIQKVASNEMSTQEMADNGPKETWVQQTGYLTYDAFKQFNEDCNPLAVRAVFDTFATSTNSVAPLAAQEMLDEYKADPSGEAFKKAIIASKLTSVSSLVVLLFLLGLADVLAFGAASRGWFPEWPGNDHLPLGLIDPGLWTIPQYWK